MYFQYTTVALLLLELVTEVCGNIKCRECENRFGSCDSGECVGQSCIMMEAITNGVRSVTKKCSQKPATQNSCEISRLMSEMEKRTCTCNSQWCNSDEEMSKQNGARAQTAIDRSKRGNYGRPGLSISTNYLVMLIFMCLFIVGSFSLLIFNTVCVHLC